MPTSTVSDVVACIVALHTARFSSRESEHLQPYACACARAHCCTLSRYPWLCRPACLPTPIQDPAAPFLISDHPGCSPQTGSSQPPPEASGRAAAARSHTSGPLRLVLRQKPSPFLSLLKKKVRKKGFRAKLASLEQHNALQVGQLAARTAPPARCESDFASFRSRRFFLL